MVLAETSRLGRALVCAAALVLLATPSPADPTEARPRSWCAARGEYLYDDPGNTFPPQQCTWRARREAKFFQQCIDRAPRPRHAHRWIEFARACGFEIADQCVPGSIAVSRNGRFGHVGVCTADLGADRIRIVDMNNDGANDGACRDGHVVKASLYRFIVPPSDPRREEPRRNERDEHDDMAPITLASAAE